jgi:hypothetical protein
MQNRTTFVAEENGRLIGFHQYEPPDHIDMTYVIPNGNAGSRARFLRRWRSEAGNAA